MTYNFDQIIDRRNTNSLKWNVGEGELPMWVADMDFETAPAVKAAIQKRAAHGVFGYTDLPEEWYEAYIHWWEKRHGLSIQKQWLVFCTGVVPAISSIVRKLTTPAEKVLIQTPVYNIFFNSILNNGRQVLESPLLWDGRKYSMDFTDLEQKLSDPQTTLMILCNPHNPVGKIWDKETLARIGALCEKHHVTVISDEIHCDLTAPGCQYTPFAAAGLKPSDVLFTGGTTAGAYLPYVQELIDGLEADCAAQGMEFNWFNTVDGVTFLDYVKNTALTHFGVTAKEGTDLYKNFDVQVYYSRYLDLK